MSLDRIVIDPNIRDGQPHIRGTRITVTAILQLLAERKSFEDIMEKYSPSVTVEDIKACLMFAVSSLPDISEFEDSYTRTMEKRIRALETERALLEVQRNKFEEERDNLKVELIKLRQPPLFVGTIHSLLESGKAIVKSSTGPLFAVVVDSSIPRDLLVPGAQVLLHQRNFAILEVVLKNQDSDN
ncbi:MAG: DUF433 domain-containing protein [Promethearchaeota archaeon]